MTPDRTTVEDETPPDLQAIAVELARSRERLRIALDAAGMVGTWDWDILNDRIYANERFAELYGIDPAKAADGAPISDYLSAIHPDDLSATEQAIDATLRNGAPYDHVYRLIQKDGSTRYVLSKGKVEFEDGQPTRFPGVTIDITDRKRAEQRQIALLEIGDLLRDMTTTSGMAQAAMSIVGKMTNVARAGYAKVDVTQTFADVEDDWCRDDSIPSIQGVHNLRSYGSFHKGLKQGQPISIPDVAKDPRTSENIESFERIRVKALLNVPLLENGRFVGLLFLHDDAVHHWALEKVDFLRNVADRIHAALERARAERERQLLVHELKHRLKNTLAIVMSISGQTLRAADNLEDARMTLEKRISALASSHDLLTLSNHTGAPLKSVIEDVARLIGNDAQRVRTEGDDVTLNSRSAILFSLILHEMATNALKYGALSLIEGYVDIRWSVKDGMFNMTWEEKNGPTVSAPTRRGFGSRMIERTLSASFGGNAKLEHAPEGTRLDFTAAFDRLAS